MFRELSQIVLAIQLSALNKLPSTRVQAWAHAIQDEAVKVDIDPVEIVAIMAHESKFDERAVSGDAEDYGLLQIRAKYYPNVKPEWFFNGEYNIKVGANVIRISKEICRKRLRREPTTQEWLAAFQGSRPCVPTKLTKLVDDFAKCLSYRVDVNDVKVEIDRVEYSYAADCRKIYWN